jgi:hypothetical protein
MDWAAATQKKLTPMATPRERSFVIYSPLSRRKLNPNVSRSTFHLADYSITWRGFERRRNADPLRHRERFRFELTAREPHSTEEDDADDQEVGQNWHSHRISPN